MRIHDRVYKVGPNALKDILRMQRSTNLTIPKAPFARLVHEYLQIVSPTSDLRIQRLAVEALHEATEIYLTTLLQDANLCTLHAKRATLRVNDIQLVLNLRGPWDPAFSFCH